MTIICLIGPSGSGKTTLAEAMADGVTTPTVVTDPIPTLCSYTTRPMRPGEQNGREHIFISEAEAHRLLATRRPMAYTLFGGYRYFALWEQVAPLTPPKGGMTSSAAPVSEGFSRGIITYVIDEAGYHALLAQSIELQDELKNAYGIHIEPITLLPIRIERNEEALAQTIDPARLRRDQGREAFDGTIPYRIIIHNDAPNAEALTEWSQHLRQAIRLYLICHQYPVYPNPVHLTTHMGVAEIIAALNGAI